MKFIIFDLDETLGYFKQLYFIFSVLKKINASFSITQPIFNRVLDLFPEFLRPNILDILGYLKQQKKFHRNTYLIIYTNNIHPNWTRYIQTYIEHKLHSFSEGKEDMNVSGSVSGSSPSSFSLFDKMIDAQRHTSCRQHQRKHLDDLFRCIDYSAQSSICYIDNEYHPGMKSRHTHYCKLSSYVHNLPTRVVADRLQVSGLLEEIIPGTHLTVFANIYEHYCENKYSKTLSPAEYRYELRTSQELMLKVRIFFMNSTTHKRRHTYSSLHSGPHPSVGTATSDPTPHLPFSLERHSEAPLTRVSDPLFNYYHNSSFRRELSFAFPSWSSSLSTSSQNKTKKNRRLI
jgi:hypothetical protein